MTSLQQNTFLTKDYRNCRYQGLAKNLEPYGQGILLDDNLRFIVGTWFKNELNGNVIAIDSHQKYIYGRWQNGLPQGINVYRGGQTILIANFSEGKIIGKFLVIFETQRLLLTIEISKSETSIINRIQNINKNDIQRVGKQILPDINISKMLSLINFMNQSYGLYPQTSGLQFIDKDDYIYLGIKNGLGIILGYDSFIHKVGHLSFENQLIGIGGSYTASLSKQGDFESEQIITSKQRQSQELKYILHHSFLKSLVFQNSYLPTKVTNILHYINSLLKQNVILKLAEQTSHDSRKFIIQQFNDSLQYYQKDAKQNQKLRKMRAQLYLSIGRPGSEIKPISDSKINQFISMQEKQANRKNLISNKYANFGKLTTYGMVQNNSQQTARFQILNFKKQSSHLPSEKKTNSSIKTLNINKAGWIEECKQVIDARKSRSPIKRTSIHVPSSITKPIITEKSISFGNKQSYSYLNGLQNNRNSSSIKQKRDKILNDYRNIESITRFSPPKTSIDNIALSPSRNLRLTNKHSRHESTDIKTISRRLDKIQITPSISPQRYSYLHSFI